MSKEKESDLDKKLRYIEKKDVAMFVSSVVRHSRRTANRMVEKCFDKCVEALRSKHLGDGEIECVQNCTAKYLELTNRMYQRFQEIQEKEMKSASPVLQQTR